jgi:hypothetical protein
MTDPEQQKLANLSEYIEGILRDCLMACHGRSIDFRAPRLISTELVRKRAVGTFIDRSAEGEF